MNKYYGFIYKTTLPDGRYYIGQHKIISNNTLDPNYLGSGVIIKDYIKSKGKEGIIREILEYGNSRNELNELENKYITSDIINDPLNINLDTGGKHIDTRLPSVKRKIGDTISKLRTENPERWPSRKGKQNNKSVNWKLISPSGDEFYICGGLNEFCREHGISSNTIKKAIVGGWIPNRGVCAGWRAFNLDTGNGTVRETKNHGIHISGENNPYHKSKHIKIKKETK